MFRIYVPSLDIDIQYEDLDTLRKILIEIKAGNYIIQETGWLELESEKVAREDSKPSVGMEDMYWQSSDL